MDPYKVLGVPQGADQETIKKAYKELIRKYHPDQYVNNPLSDLAQEKLKEINEAYDMLTKGGGGYQSSGGSSSQSYSQQGNGAYNNIRAMINSGRIQEAENALNAMANHDAEWNFLMGCVYTQKGWYNQAVTCLQTAVAMAPDNFEYRQALNNLANRAQTYRNVGNTGGYNPSSTDCCTQLLCANLCCNCMDGNPCC